MTERNGECDCDPSLRRARSSDSVEVRLIFAATTCAFCEMQRYMATRATELIRELRVVLFDPRDDGTKCCAELDRDL